jgi:hypothetical protein
MGNRVIKTGAALIGLYLVVQYATGFGKSVQAASSGSASVIKAFQGR